MSALAESQAPVNPAPPAPDSTASSTYPPQQPYAGRALSAPINAFSPRHKSPVVAALLSLAPGLGQVYVGYYLQGFVNIAIVLTLITLGASNTLGDATPAVGFFVAFFWLYNIIDAGRRAAFYNQAISGERDVELPGSLPTAGAGGSVLFGLGRLVAGGVLLSNTAFGLSLDWVEAWWPLAPMGIGVYLLGRSMLDRAKTSPAD